MGGMPHKPAQITKTKRAFSLDYDSRQAINTKGRMVNQASPGNIPAVTRDTTGFAWVVRAEGRFCGQAL